MSLVDEAPPVPRRRRWREGLLIVAVLVVAAAILVRERLRDDRIVVIDTARVVREDTVRIKR
jgi:hypothetical protein